MPTSETNRISDKEVKHVLKREVAANNALLTHCGRRTCLNIQNEILIAAEGVCKSDGFFQVLQMPWPSDNCEKLLSSNSSFPPYRCLDV